MYKGTMTCLLRSSASRPDILSDFAEASRSALVNASSNCACIRDIVVSLEHGRNGREHGGGAVSTDGGGTWRRRYAAVTKERNERLSGGKGTDRISKDN